jgi:hypothetical protein
VTVRSRSCYAALTALLAVALAGCGQAGSGRPLVAAYVRHVQRLETQLQTPLRAVGRAGSVFSSETSGRSTGLGGLAVAANEASLRAALHQMVALRVKLSAAPAPLAAVHLRTLVLRLADRQLALTREVAQLVLFLPSFNDAIAPLAAATRSLQQVLSQGGAVPSSSVTAVYTQRAVALRGFASHVRAIAGRVRRLRPPPVSVPAYRSQLASLTGMRQAADALAGALESQQTGRVAPLLVAFDRAATLNQTTAAQRAQIAAVDSYNRQVRALKQLVDQIDRERFRIDRTVS